MVQARGLLELTRPGNAVAAGALTGIGAFVASASADELPLVAAAVAATVFATAAGNAINDYFDRDIDRINAPERPIPSGAVSPRGALGFSALLFALAAGCALLLPPLALGIAVVNLLLLVAYTKFFKGTPGAGNALVAGLGGSTFLFGGATVGNPEPTVVLALLAAVSTLAREIIKDVEDVDGDREEGLSTLPVVVGEHRALVLALALLVVAALASPLPYLLDMLGLSYLVVVAPAVAVMLYAGYEGFDDPTAGQGHLKYGMFLAILSFVVGRATLVFSI
ncbi:geranylgeranylglycerol-phosphate geranylgeranyltransferase [Halosimplex salinum]|uniref:geranylgeranylglycerol-phosphate geranylgeranyltransferase n=1 Tax=Halosimplex salinum TaxID=1710538 RepID=UPI000F4AE4E6|nr:geranylgeranylglycerol-phosphate geranylgeranyltransferase [Halosimplex salinum]